jgi:hypothetical protein
VPTGGVAVGAVIAAPSNAASPTALAEIANPVIQRKRVAFGLIVITVRDLL